jgi:hypothetical protein
MNINRIYLGTWLPRTHIHLEEIYHFLKSGYGVSLDENKIKNLRDQLSIKTLNLNNNQDFDNIKFISEEITVTITEDGVISLMLEKINGIDSAVKKIESFYINKLGPALGYLFSRGAPLPQTLLDIKEIYPKIFVGENILQDEAEKLLKSQNDQLLTQISSDNLIVFFGKETRIITMHRIDASIFNSFIENLIFTQAYSDLLRRYLIAHRSIWTDISLIKESRGLRHRDFTAIRNKILDFLKTISFIQTRLQQMNEILRARNMVVPEVVKQKLIVLGLESFSILESSSRYFSNLWQMTADYANSTLVLFQSLTEENAQREIRLLQQITAASMLIGFFGMNIAFPWEERWPDIFISSFVVIGIIMVTMGIFYQILRKIIDNRHFNISDQNKNS